MSDDFDDSPLRFHILTAVGGQLHHDFMPVHRSLFFACRNINILQVSLIIRTHKPEIFAFFIESHNMHHTVREYPHDLSFPAPSRWCRRDNILYLVSLKCSRYILLRNEYIFRAVFRRYEPESSRICLEDSFQAHSLTLAVFPSF